MSKADPVPPWLAELLENAADAITLTDRGSGSLLGVSRSFCALSGYSSDELIGTSAAEIGLPPALDPSAPRAVPAPRRLELRARDGTRRTVEISTQAVNEDRVLLTIIREVADRDRAEHELAARQAQSAHVTAELAFRDIIESAPDAMVVVDAQGDIVFVNAQTERLFDYAREELIGRCHELLVPEALRQRHRAHRARYADIPRARPMGAGLTLYGRRKDGSEFPVEISLSPLGSDTEPLVCSAIRDASARVRIEQERNRATEELRDSRTRLAEAERIAAMGSWEGDLRTDVVVFSDGLLEIHGLAAGQFHGSAAAARELIYPEDRERFDRALCDAIAARSTYTVEYRAIRADGRVRILRGHGDVLVDETGSPTRIVGIVQDITDAKRTQQALQSTSDELGRHAGDLQQLALSTASESREPREIPHAPLTARQLEILQLIAHGLTNASIADRLVLTEGTIKWHVRQILAKTNTANRAEAIARVLGSPQ